MKYKIAVGADFHWGVIDPEKQRRQLRFFLEWLTDNDVDAVVICGDYYDHRLSLNSKASIYALQFFDDLCELGKKKNFLIRIFDGTTSHDYDQLEALRVFEDGHNVRIFRQTSAEELLPGFNCIYCPDELLNNDDYFVKYNDILLNDKHYDAMFFHGTFDAQMGEFTKQIAGDNVVFEMSVFSRLCNVMIGGHWHDADSIGDMHYTRSLISWEFGETNPKGFIVLDYDTETKAHEVKRVINPYADVYSTHIVDTSIYNDRESYSRLMQSINNAISKKRDIDLHIRIMIYITDEKELNKVAIETLKQEYSSVKNVKIVIENKVAKAKKTEKTQKLNRLKDSYGFLFNNASIASKYREFIKLTKNIDVDEDIINEIIKPCLEETINGKEKCDGRVHESPSKRNENAENDL